MRYRSGYWLAWLTVSLLWATVAFPQSDTKPLDTVVRWTRAIDRDDTIVLRQLLPLVDPGLSNEKGKTALMSAAKTGDIQLLDSLVSRGLSIADRSRTGGSSLMYAVLGNQLEMIDYLLAQVSQFVNPDAFINAESVNGWTAAMIAAAKGFDKALQQLVETGQADPWKADAYQWTPLMRAIDNRHRSVVSYLLSLDRLPLDSVNENGATALHVAVEKGDTQTVTLLLKKNINHTLRDNQQRTALDIAVSLGNNPMVELLSR